MKVNHVTVEKLWGLERPIDPIARCSPKNEAAYECPITGLYARAINKHGYHRHCRDKS